MLKHKKLLSALLAAIMLFSLTACGGGNDEEPAGEGGGEEGGATSWEETANMSATDETDEELYEQAIAEAGGLGLQLLGLGHNGHIGFNEPAPEFPKETHCVALTESTINANSRLFDSADDVPREAYTMGIGTIMAAKEILVVANGADKADIVRRAFFGPVTPEVPASILQFHPNVTVVVDKEAAALCQ